ncbi:D-alanyl-D-alanine carboxypeptidase family protein [Paraconexibacter sp.]|uniref:D-alanyl-D-alanine carboxypeptidase family protein n=1 Tax=Paraconexibacter sp. TaxID=2949640 RepID=UPI0035687EBE
MSTPDTARPVTPLVTLLALVLTVLGLAAAAPAGALAQGSSSRAPSLKDAASAILVEPATGDIVVGKRIDQRRAIASTTKMMTALVALDEASLDDVLTATDYRPAPVESQIGLRPGERMTVRDLLRGLLLASGNDAAMTLATRIGGSRAGFVRMMNAKAREIGLRNTRFATPVGLDTPGNYSTASDLAKLALVLRRNDFARATMDMKKATLRSGARERVVRNRNLAVQRYGFVNGVKTGRTSEAGYVLVGSGSRDGVTVVSVVLGSPSEETRVTDTAALLRYGLGRYRVTRALETGQALARATLRYRDDERVALVAARGSKRVTRRDERLTTRVLDAPATVDGPLPARTRVGTIEVRYRGRTVDSVPLVTATEVAQATATDRLQDFVGRPGTKVLIGALVGCSLLLLLLRRRISLRGASQRGSTETA